MKAEFTDNLITGNATIDGQHRELIDKINNLLDAIETHKDKSVAVSTLDFLNDYVEYHFGEEEKLQREAGYPGIEDHIKQHNALRKTVADLTARLEDEEGPSNAFVEQLNKQVINWLYLHIEGFDRSVAEFIALADHPDRL
jgi:hemerythrin